jgi:hypothetical protein
MERRKQIISLFKYVNMTYYLKISIILFLLSACQLKKNQIITNTLPGKEKSYSDFIDSNRFVLDSIICDLNSDGMNDLVLILEYS